MGLKSQLDYMIGSYLEKVTDCDSCMAQFFCIKNNLRKSREPQNYCNDNLNKYLKHWDVTQ